MVLEGFNTESGSLDGNAVGDPLWQQVDIWHLQTLVPLLNLSSYLPQSLPQPPHSSLTFILHKQLSWVAPQIYLRHNQNTQFSTK